MRNSAQYWSQDDEAQLLVSDGMVPTMTVPVTIERTYPYGNAAPPVTGMDPHESAECPAEINPQMLQRTSTAAHLV